MMNLRILTAIMVCSMGLPLLAQAEAAASHDMHGMDMPEAVISATTNVPVAAETESTKAFKAADAKMHKAMMANAYTGDADVDFLRGMIPHHQGAVDMANIVLKYGTDADVRMMAGDIIKAQENEIRWMKNWLAKHGPTDASASDARVEIPATVPVAVKPVEKDAAKVISPVSEKAAAPVAKVAVAAIVISSTVTTSGTDVSSSVPVSDVSGTTAAVEGAATAMMVDDMPQGLTPDMPAADEEIENAAPRMELLDSKPLRAGTSL